MKKKYVYKPKSTKELRNEKRKKQKARRTYREYLEREREELNFLIEKEEIVKRCESG